jgi:hypothetical protein
MRIAVDGPTSDARITTMGIVKRNAALRHPRREGVLTIEKKSSDHRYDSSVGCVAPESMPNEMYPFTASARITHSRTSTREACMVKS